MSPLARKLLRDLIRLKWQAIAIAMVLGSGVATFTMSLSSLQSLKGARDAYYEKYRFGQAFARLKRAPEGLSARLAEIPGVARVCTRVTMDVNLNIHGFGEPAVGRLLSLPDSGEPALNALHYRSGRPPGPDRRGEVVLSETFATAHDLAPGDHLGAVINGRMERLTIVGIALSPEFVYEIREGEMLPDHQRFGALWMTRRELAAAFDLEGAFNDLVVSLAPGANEREVVARIDNLIEPYGGLGAFGRADHVSHRFLDSEITQLRAMAVIAPSIFLSVTAFLLNMVITRLIGTQREQIAILRAFGYRRAEIAWHYGGFVLAIVILGVAIGTALGASMGSGLTVLYTQFFRFPILAYHLDPQVPAVAIIVSITAGMVGAWNALRRGAMLPPAEAMRPEAPAVFRPTAFDRLGAQRWLRASGRMVVRHIELQPIRAVLSVLGMSLATAVLVVGAFMGDTVDYVLDFQFRRTQRQDLTVTFRDVESSAALSELESMSGVRSAEPFRAVPTRIHHGHRSARVGMLGIPEGTGLFVPLDSLARRIDIPTSGLVISDALAEQLDARVGDRLHVEVLDGRRPREDVEVRGIATDFAGRTAYMDLAAVQRLMSEGDTVSGAYVAADPAAVNRLYSQLKESPGVAAVVIRDAAIDVFRKTIAENLLRMRSINIAFACVIAFGVVYNSTRISLAERARELATLRVIGFTRREVSAILLGELAIITAIAIPLGLAEGYGLAALVTAALQSSDQRFPLVVEPSTFAMAGIITAAAAAVSGLFVRRGVNRFDLVAVLKSRE